jgi:hypothetical protein
MGAPIAAGSRPCQPAAGGGISQIRKREKFRLWIIAGIAGNTLKDNRNRARLLAGSQKISAAIWC